MSNAAKQMHFIRLIAAVALIFLAVSDIAFADWRLSDSASTPSADLEGIYFDAANRTPLTVLHNGVISGNIDAFRHLGGVLLPVSTFSAILGIPMKVDAENGVATGRLPNNSALTIIPRKHSILIGGDATIQVSDLMFLHENDIYVDVAILSELFRFTIIVDDGSGTLRVSDGSAGTQTLPWLSASSSYTSSDPDRAEGSLPADTVVQPVKVSDINASQSPSTPVQPPPPPIAKPGEGEPLELQPMPLTLVQPHITRPAESGESEPLVLQLIVDDMPMEEFIEGVQQNGRLYLPLGQLASLLNFPITVDPHAGTATGWFIREENTFALAATTIEVKGNTMTISPESVLQKDQDLFVDNAMLRQWFPLDFAIDRYRMTLNINAREALPFEEKLRREKLRAALGQQKTASKDVTYKTVDYPYAAASSPFVYLTVGSSYQSQNHDTGADYSALAAGDLAYMNSRLYAAGNLNEKAISDLRLTLGREDYERKLLGPANASAFSIGDTNSVGLALVSSSSPGRGFTLSNRARDRSDKFDVTSFIGDSTPGWEVELYRNGVLIESQTVGTNGRYEFKEVPILFGNNSFRLAFFGPQGQMDEIVKNVNAGSSLLNGGEVTYNISVDQKARTLFGIADTASQNTGGTRTVGELEYGINRWLTVAAGSAHTVIRDEGHNYATTGLRTSLAGILASVDSAYDASNNGTSTRLAMFANYFDTDFHFQHKMLQEFISEEDNNNDNPLTRLTDAGFDRQSELPLLGQLNAGLSFTRREFASGRKENLLRNRLSKSIYGVNLTNALQYDYDNQDSDNLTGTMSVRGFYGHILLGAQMDYNVKPDASINNFKITGSYPIAPGIGGNTAILKDLAGDKRTELENTITFDVKQYKLSFTGRADSNKTYFVGMSLNLSFGKVPSHDQWLFSSQNMAETGTVIVHPYLDRNYNQQRDEGEEVPPNVAMKIGSRALKPDSHDMVVAKNLTTNLPVSIRLDQERQDNPFWTAAVDEYRVVPRPGTPVVMDYPLFETSQIDGTVHVPSGTASSLKVELVNTEGQVVGFTHTAFDGYYLLQGVMPGTYEVRVAEDSLAQHRLRQEDERILTVKEADFYTKDIALMQ